MEPQLQLLIDHLEIEKAGLELQLADALIEGDEDFEFAAICKNRINLVKNQLDKLRYFDDTLFEKRERIYKLFKYLEKLQQQEVLSEREEFQLKKFEEIQNAAFEQTQIPKNPLPTPNENKIELLLQQLVNKEIKGFTITLNHHYNIQISFTTTKKQVTILLPNIYLLTSNNVIDTYIMAGLHSLGFIPYKKHLLLKHNTHIPTIMILVSKIVFDKFHRYLRDKKNTIKIIAK